MFVDVEFAEKQHICNICQQNAWLWAWQVMLDFWQGQKFSSFQLHPDCCWGYPASNLKDKWQAA
jgi:hypothetical protein